LEARAAGSHTASSATPENQARVYLYLTELADGFQLFCGFEDTFSMNRPMRIRVIASIARIGGLPCAGLFVFLMVAGATVTRAQAPADSELDRLTASAEQGDAAVQLELGIRYYNGAGSRQPPDYAEALKWFRRAADQGNAEAQDRLGLMYYNGKGVSQDYVEAGHWYLLAAQGGNDHAAYRLVEMYSRGVGLPRDRAESKKWANVLNARHPDKMSALAWKLFAIGVLGVVAFSIGLFALQRNVLMGWRRLTVAIFVNLAGVALVLNTLTTYGFEIVFPHCAHNFLATACTQISDPNTRKIVNEIGDWAVVNLIFRFMAGIGLVLDVLAVWYVVYLCRRLFRRPSMQHRESVVAPSAS
jgi:hypothetical protein